MDGHYGSTMDIRLQAADTVIYLDFPRHVCLWRVIKRYVRNRGRTRPDVGEGCQEKIDLEFLLYIWRFKGNKKRILQRLETSRGQGKQIVRLRSNNQVNHYLISVHPQMPLD